MPRLPNQIPIRNDDGFESHFRKFYLSVDWLKDHFFYPLSFILKTIEMLVHESEYERQSSKSKCHACLIRSLSAMVIGSKATSESSI